MLRYRDQCRAFLLLAALALPIGCGGSDGPVLGRVSGRVTLDGQPLEMATVEFVPEMPEGSSSSGVTDASGRYELMYLEGRRGSLPGKYVVRITTWRQEHVPGGTPHEIAERVPSSYNTDSGLRRDVTTGSNTLDFELDSASASDASTTSAEPQDATVDASDE